MNAVITPSQLSGTIRVPASKSQAHRLLICAALSDAPTDITCRELSQDIEATAACLNAMGGDIVYDSLNAVFHVTPLDRTAAEGRSAVIDVGESGSTLRFLLPVICALGIRAHIVMHGRLPHRPLRPLWKELEAHGCRLTRNEDLSIDTDGRLSGDVFTIPADISSQFVSGLLFAMPLIKRKAAPTMPIQAPISVSVPTPVPGSTLAPVSAPPLGSVPESASTQVQISSLPSIPVSTLPPVTVPTQTTMSEDASERKEIRLCGRIESKSYINMTIDSMRRFGIDAKCNESIISIEAEADRGYRSCGSIEVEGDWSNGAFWVCMSEMTDGRINITGLDSASLQGDRAVMELKKLITGKSRFSFRDKVTIDARNIPDIVPVLAALAAASCGETVFEHAKRLRLKESDRIRSTVEMLSALGAEVYETEDGLRVIGTGSLRGGTADSCRDHRIAMSAAAASVICAEPVTVKGAQAVRKSYPLFWEDFKRLGGRVIFEDD